jgi:hypothetical protein
MNSERRSFNAKYYEVHNWLEYSISRNAVFAFPAGIFLIIIMFVVKLKIILYLCNKALIVGRHRNSHL